MAICPFAVKKLIPPGYNDPRIIPRLAILHVDAGNAYDLFSYFNGPSDGIESHFHGAKDGTIFQYRDTNWQADANYKANPFAISIETQGFGPGEWTPQQIQSIKKLLLWIHKTHDVPLRKADRWNGSGIGYHIQFGSPGYWTNVAKSCPGPQRIKQFNDILVPWFKTQPESEDDMSLRDQEADYWYPGDKNSKDKMQLAQQLGQARGFSHADYKATRRVEAKLDVLLEAFKKLQPELTQDLEAALTEALKDAVVDVDVNVGPKSE